MKILFISDIHANIEALSSLKPLFSDVDKVICLGDIVGYFCHVNEVCEFLIEHNVICVKGNHDIYLLDGFVESDKFINESVRFGIQCAKDIITTDNKNWLIQLPTSISLRMDNVTFMCCHGSPWDPSFEYIYEDSSLLNRMNEFNADVIALGHTHRRYVLTDSNQIIFNPGSVGQSRDTEGLACALIFDTFDKSIELVQMPYNFTSELEYAQRMGADTWIYKHFKSIFKSNLINRTYFLLSWVSLPRLF